MKVLYASDPHGSELHFERVFGAALTEQAELLILGGDIAPDLPSPREQANWVDQRFSQLISQFRRQGGCPVVGITGNHDTTMAQERLAAVDGFELLGGKATQFGELALTGFCLVPPSPYYLKDAERLDRRGDRVPGNSRTAYCTGPDGAFADISEPEHFPAHPSIEEELAARTLPAPQQTILVNHTPPSGGVLDRLPKGGVCGSQALREFISRWQPKLSLHGHIHESPFVSGRCGERIGRTICINAGQDVKQPVWAAFDLRDIEGTWRHSRGLKLELSE